MDDEFLDAIDKTVDASFDASVPINCTGDPITAPVVLNLLADPRLAIRPSGIKARGFLKGERKSIIEPEMRPVYLGPPSLRVGLRDF
jgi:hypothetical protein